MERCLRGPRHMGILLASRNPSQQWRETDASKLKTCVQRGQQTQRVLSERKLISENSLEISIKFLASKPVRELRSAIRLNHEPLRESAQVVPDYVTSVVRKRDRTNRDTEQVAVQQVTTRLLLKKCRLECALVKCRAQRKNVRLWCVW